MSVFIGDIGVKIILDVGIDITAATAQKIKYRKPSGEFGSWTAVQETSTSISYTTIAATDLNEIGNWLLQSYVITPSWTLSGKIAKFNVIATI
jgi:hypothetical protein